MRICHIVNCLHVLEWHLHASTPTNCRELLQGILEQNGAMHAHAGNPHTVFSHIVCLTGNCFMKQGNNPIVFAAFFIHMLLAQGFA